MRRIIQRINSAAVWHYTTTFLLMGSIACLTQATALAASNKNEAQLRSASVLKQTLIAEFALARQDVATAVHEYTVLAIRTNSTTIKQRALNIALEHNDLNAALDIARFWVVAEPKDTPALFYLAHIALRTHQYALAADTLERILNLDDNADLEQILTGISPETLAEREDLLLALAKSKERDNPSILVLIAGLQSQNNQYNAALETINLALSKRPKVTSYILMKASLLMALQDHSAAQQWYALARKRNPKNLDVHLAEARFLIKQRQPQLALERLEKIVQQWPNNDEAKFIAGLTSIDLKQYMQADQFLLGLTASNEYQNDAYYYLAVNAERQQLFARAAGFYRLVDGSLYLLSRRNLIAIYEKQQQQADALRFLTQERVNYPQHTSFLYQLQAEILTKMDDQKAAITLLDEAIASISDDPELIYAQVLLLDPFTQREKLDRRLKQLLKLEPNSPTYLNAYAYTLALQNRRLSEAQQYAEIALENAPEQPSILDTLGYIAFLQNNFVSAERYLAKAFKNSQNMNIGIRYARSLYMQGKIQAFEQLLQQLKQKYPSHPQLQQLDGLILKSVTPIPRKKR